jgi:hypothetical protein
VFAFLIALLILLGPIFVNRFGGSVPVSTAAAAHRVEVTFG